MRILGIFDGFGQVRVIGKSATQPCPCGNYGNPNQECTCNSIQIQKYVGKISGPLLDRIDIHVEVPAVRYNELAAKRTGEALSTIRTRVVESRERQKLGLSARAYDRILKVSRTIADLAV